MSNPISKDVYLKNPTTGGEIQLGAVDIERRGENDMSSFQRPRPAGNPPLTKALNLNQYKRPVQINGVINDEYASNVAGRGTLTIQDKEDWLVNFENIVFSADLLELNWGSVTYDGYVKSYRVKERAKDENTVFEIQLTFLESVPMRQGNQ